MHIYRCIYTLLYQNLMVTENQIPTVDTQLRKAIQTTLKISIKLQCKRTKDE